MSAPELWYVEACYEDLVDAGIDEIDDLSLHELIAEASGDVSLRQTRIARRLLVELWKDLEVVRAGRAWTAASDGALIRLAPGGRIEHLPIGFAVHPDSGPRHELVVVRDGSEP